jgi:hypothetical protein
MISEPRQSKIKGMKSVSNNNDDVESHILDKGKEKRIKTNEELDSLSSWEHEELGFALQNSQLFQYPLQIGNGASKLFQEGTNSRP